MVIVTAGSIGAGKSSVAKILGEHFGTKVFYEKVEGNRVLEKFYTASEEEIQLKRYPFLLQLEFLSSRFKSIKEALTDDNNILDRSIWEDILFCKVNHNLGRISDLELEIYMDLFENMMEELKELPKKSPDLLVYLKCSFETMMKRIQLRDRSFETNPELESYYYKIWENYDNWVMNCYKASEVLIVDMDTMDVVNNPNDRAKLLQMVDDKLKEIRQEDENYLSLEDDCNSHGFIEFEYNKDNKEMDIQFRYNCLSSREDTIVTITEEKSRKLKDFINKNVK